MDLNKPERASLDLDGSISPPAAENLRGALAAIQGVRNVEVAPDRASVVVAYDPCLVKPMQLRLAARLVGCGVTRIVLPGTEILERSSEPPARLLVAPR